MAFIKPPAPSSPPDDRRVTLRGPGGLLEQLDDPRPQVRRWAVRDLSAHPEAIPALLAQLSREGADEVREALLTALLALGGEQVVAGLLPLLASEDPGLRNGVADVLQALPRDTRGCAERLLTDATPRTRIYGLECLRRQTGPGLYQGIATVLAGDPDENVCALAAECAAELGFTDFIPLLTALPGRFPGSPYIPFVAQTALGTLEKANGHGIDPS